MYNSTIIVKRKSLKCGHYSYNFSKGRCKDCATREDALIRINEANEREDETLSDLIKEADAIFSKYIRLKYADKNGNVKCYTCDKKMKVEEAENGHYISRYNMLLRFDERNCRPQCTDCNQYKKGNLLEYAKRLEQERCGITDILFEEANIVYKFSRVELKELIINYKQKVNHLKII